MSFLCCFLGYLLMSHDALAQINSSYFPFKDSYLIRGTLTDAVVLNLNADALPDVLVADSLNDNLTLFYNIGGCPNSLSRKSTIVTGDGPVALATADFNDDGREDVVVLNALSATVSVYKNYIDAQGTPGIQNAGTYTTSHSPRIIKIKDVDRDGKTDLVVMHGNGLLYIFRNTSSANIQFEDAFILTTNAILNNFDLEDLDNDDKADLALISDSNGGRLLLFQNQSTPGHLAFLPVAEKNTSFSPTAIALADIDGDGKKDILIGGLNNEQLLVWHNEFSSGLLSASAIGSPLYFRTAGGISDIKVADLDGNEKLEVLMVHSAIDSLSILTNHYSGIWDASFFLSPETLGLGDAPTSLMIADINADGKKDLVNTNHEFRNLGVLYGKQNHCTDNGVLFPATAAHYYIRYNPGDFVLTASGNGILNWYGDSTLTQLMGSGNQFNTPWLEHTDTFYVTNSVSCCESEPVAVIAAIQCSINPPVAASFYHCGSGSISLHAESSEQLLWYKQFKDTTVIARGPVLTTRPLTKSDTFYVAAFRAGCRSQKTKVIASIFPSVKTHTVNAETGICLSEGITLSINVSQKYVQYDVLENGNIHTYPGNGAFLKLGNYPLGTALQVVASNPCDSITLPIAYYDSQVPVIPNLITANGDGKNDYFTISNLPSSAQLQIFNNWGAKVFTSDHYQNNWGAEESNGIYFYELQFYLCGELKKYSGWLQLTRN